MRKRALRLRTVVDAAPRPLVVLTYNLQDIQPWKQTTPRYQTAVYLADDSGMATNTPARPPVDYPNEEQAKQGHQSAVAALRR